MYYRQSKLSHLAKAEAICRPVKIQTRKDEFGCIFIILWQRRLFLWLKKRDVASTECRV